MRILSYIFLLLYLSGCSIFIAQTGSNNSLLKIRDKKTLLSKLGEPQGSFSVITSTENPKYDLGKAVSYDVFNVHGNWFTHVEGCGYGFAAMATFGVSEVISIPLATASIISGAFRESKLIAFYTVDDRVERFELYDSSGKPIVIRNHC